MVHWIEKYIGEKWQHDFNCFHWFCLIQDREFGHKGISELNPPSVEDRGLAFDFIKNNKDIYNKWERVFIPEEGDAIIWGDESSNFHIGTYVCSDRIRGVLHCCVKNGLCLTSMESIRANNADSRIMLRWKK